MFNLTEDELDKGFRAIEHHGYGSLLPPVAEWRVLKDNWPAIRASISTIDLDTYSPIQPLRVYAPKNRATVRVVHLLHPIDLIIYTSLTLIVAPDIEAQRIAKRRRIVFSYRFNPEQPDRLYDSNGAYADFKQKTLDKSQRHKFISSADIADFYPRIYQHRLENIIESSASNQRTKDVARVLVPKFLSNLFDKNSYGIPVGPYASRILAEAVLIDIDAFLESERISFIRWVDDFYLFHDSEKDAQSALIALAKRLYDHHGLTLSASKTRINTRETMLEKLNANPQAEINEQLERLSGISSRIDPYFDEEIDLSPEEIADIIQIDIAQLIQDAVRDDDLSDYRAIAELMKSQHIIENFSSESRIEILNVLIKNSEHLYPLAHQFAEFVKKISDLEPQKRKTIKSNLLKTIRSRHGKWPPDYYMLWVLSIFSSSTEWGIANEFVQILKAHRSEIVRREALLAIAANGDRAQALEAKEKFPTSSKLERCAILLATNKLGRDERRHWRQTLQLTESLEKLL